MKVSAANLALSSALDFSRRVEKSLRVEVSHVTRPEPVTKAESKPDTVDLSANGMAAAQAAGGDDAAVPPQLAVLRSLLKRLFGIDVEHGAEFSVATQTDTAAVAQQSATAEQSKPHLQVDYREHREEHEQLRVGAEGWVRTADGQRIAFKLDIALDRQFSQDLQLDVRTGRLVPQKKDPLVINFAGTAAQLADGRFDFDLDQDGRVESISRLGGGSGFLVLDRNADGQVNDGGELFGARSGDGFADLSTYDDDGNDWIDESDAVYSRLGVWQPDGAGQGVVRSLKAADVGAIALSHVASPYEYRDAANESLASLRSTGVYLKESGGSGTVQQLDLFI